MIRLWRLQSLSLEHVNHCIDSIRLVLLNFKTELHYSTLLTVCGLYKQLRTLLQHLSARNNLQSEEAYKLSKELTDLGFPLYPAMKSDSHYRDLSEYYLLLRNLQKLGRYSEFVLRLNPFLTELLYTLLMQTEFAGYLKKEQRSN